MDKIDKIVWVLFWEYHDKSSSGILRVYDNEIRAKQDFELVHKIEDSKIYTLFDCEITD